MSLFNFATKELDLAGIKGGFLDELMRESILSLIKVFETQDHSGFSAPIAIDLFSKLALYKPISPLTGEDEEWMEVREGVYQNKRHHSVFKDHGRAYDIDGTICVDSDGGHFTSGRYMEDIVFPYTPTKKYIYLDENNLPIETYSDIASTPLPSSSQNSTGAVKPPENKEVHD